MMKRSSSLLVGILIFGLCLYFAEQRTGAHTLDQMETQKFIRVSDRTVVPFSKVLKDIKEVSMVFVGELHDQPTHHWAQLEVITALRNSGKNVAIGIEMFRAEDQKNLDLWVHGEISPEQFHLIYYENWNQPWSLYSTIFLFAREHRIPIVGLNIPTEIVSQVAKRGFSSLTPEQSKGLPPISCNVDEVYKDFIRRALGIPSKKGLSFQYFCEAQLVWDSAMAWHALQFMETHPDYTLVVMAGTGHSWKRAIPEQVRRNSDLTYRVILPEEPTLHRTNVQPEDSDYLWLGLPLQKIP
jgi:uncharacterized iron-regulated protein